MTSPILSLRSASKTFSGRRVLRDVDLDLRPGEVHALLGQNGSGKSTLVKILSGYHAPDAGTTLRIDGRKVALPITPGTARRHGLAFVHQELGLAEPLTVLENLRVGRFELAAGSRIRWRRERRRVRDALARFGLSCSPDTLLSELPQVDRAMVAIIRALDDLAASDAPGILILDEPTAYLPHDSTERLLETVRRATAGGVGVLFVTHRLRDVLAVADHVSVLRDGRLVWSESAVGVDESQLVERILGFAIEELYPEAHTPQGDLLLEARNIRSEGVEGFALRVHRGEIVGLTGLVGTGWERVPYVLFGTEPTASGELRFQERSYDLARLSPRQAMAAGLALLPANRFRDGGVAAASVTENLVLPTLQNYFRDGRLLHRQERSRVRELLAEYDVHPRDPNATFGRLSGGNQQKVLLAKWFEMEPTVFLMHEPTQGVDVGARQRIFSQIAASAERGKAFVLASAEYQDLANLCDRVLVFRAGRVVAELAGSNLTHDRLLDQCFRDTSATVTSRRASDQERGDGGEG